MKIMLDGREVKIGDRLYSLLEDWVVVFSIKGGNSRYPIQVRREGHLDTSSYTVEGCYLARRGSQLLFWDIPTVQAPAPPKRTVKKWLWIYRTDGSELYFTRHYYASKEQIMTENPGLYAFNDIIEPYLPTEIEVEE